MFPPRGREVASPVTGTLSRPFAAASLVRAALGGVHVGFLRSFLLARIWRHVKSARVSIGFTRFTHPGVSIVSTVSTVSTVSSRAGMDMGSQ